MAAGALDPLLGREGKAVESGHFFNPVEFDGIKTGVVDLLPDTEEFDGVAVAQPVANQIVAGFRIAVSGDIGEADVVVPFDAGDADFAGENFDLLAHGLVGVWMKREEWAVYQLIATATKQTTRRVERSGQISTDDREYF